MEGIYDWIMNISIMPSLSKKEGETMEIIYATAQDFNEIFNLMCELEEDILDKEAFATIFKKNLKNENIHYLVAKDGADIIGFISLYTHDLLHHVSKIAEVQELIVTARFQGQGIGYALLQKAKDIAIDQSCYQLEVCCNMSRTGSHKFYEKQSLAKTHYKFTEKL